MSVKIKISYERPDELHIVIKQLQPMIKTCKISGKQEGRFQRAYADLGDVDKDCSAGPELSIC